MFSKLLYWALPVHCVFCAIRIPAHFPNICPGCIADLPWLLHVCACCSLPLSSSAPAAAVCGECLQQPKPYQQLHALFSYQFPIDQLILHLKFQQQFVYAHLLGELLAERCVQHYNIAPTRPSLILPVPLHPQRVRQRGFNQAAELARPVARHLGIPISYNSVQRVKYTEAQMDLPLALRAKNLKGAFKASPALRGKHVAIIDDVVTTGHTIEALALALHKVGVRQIDVWGVARALK